MTVRNSRLHSMLSATSMETDAMPDLESRTDLDSPANMPVIGAGALVIAETGKTCEVSPYTPNYPPMKVPLVDAVVKYESPFDGRVCILLIKNALYIASMSYNLIPPFMMREAGIKLRDVPKIQVDDPMEDDHALVFPEMGLRLPLSLWGTFSYFLTTKPTMEDLAESKEVYFLTPPRWNHHSDAYAQNEESMLDWEGNIKPSKD